MDLERVSEETMAALTEAMLCASALAGRLPTSRARDIAILVATAWREMQQLEDVMKPACEQAAA